MPFSSVRNLLWPWAGRDLISLRLIALASVVAIALGVAAFGAIRLANQSASASFEQAVLSISGNSDLEISSSGANLPEKLFKELEDIEGIEAMTPLVNGSVSLPKLGSLQLLLQGYDPFSAPAFALYQSGAKQENASPDALAKGNEQGPNSLSSQTDFSRWFAYPAHVWLDSRFASQHELSVGEKLMIQNAQGKRTEVQIGGVIEASDSAAPSNRLWCDIGWAQELLSQTGTVSKILIQAKEPEALDALEEKIRTHPQFPQAASVQPPSNRSEGLRALLAGYRLNLSALALVSLLVGCFLIYGTLAATVARRTKEIAILRSLGASPLVIFSLVLGQALLLALPGVLLGLPLGAWAGEMVLETIRESRLDDLVAIASGQYQVHYLELFVAAGAGLLAALLGAIIPAWQSLRHRPLQTLRPHRAEGTKAIKYKPLLLCGCLSLLLAFASAWFALDGGLPWLSFVACVWLIVGVSFLILPACQVLGKALGAFTQVHALADLARRNFLRAQARAALTMAGLILALAMLGGVEIMIHSFRSSLDNWLNTNLKAEYFIRPIGDKANTQFGLSSELVEKLEQLSKRNSAELESLIVSDLELENGRRYTTNVIDAPSQTREFSLLKAQEGEEEALERFFAGEALLATEVFVREEGLKLGENVTLKSPHGLFSIPLAGVIIDYSDSQGSMYLAQKTYLEHWSNPGVYALALYLPEGSQDASISQELSLLTSQYGAELIDQATLKEKTLGIFDSTFQITYALRIIAILVASIGAFALMSIQLRERAAEIASLRSQGAYMGQIFRLHLWEGGFLGVATGILGTLCGVGLAALLTWVVMKAFFGWSIEFSLNPLTLLMLPLGMIFTSLFAVLIPSWQSAHAPLIRALREE